jgi:SAM-dependent methyltransferase
MTTDPRRSTSFGSAVDSYDLARPPYPREAADFVLGVTEVRHAIEVGAGTGKTTEAFVRPGLSIICLEPDSNMAARLETKGLGVEVVRDTFEDWPGPDEPADLVFAGQAWHWLDRDTACARARSWLRPGGVIALLWNIPRGRYDLFESIYRRHAPRILEERDERVRLRDTTVWLDDIWDAGFEDARLNTFTWPRTMSAGEVRTMFSSQSDHIALTAGVRETVLDEVAAEVGRMGGHVTWEYETRVFVGIAPGVTPPRSGLSRAR